MNCTPKALSITHEVCKGLVMHPEDASTTRNKCINMCNRQQQLVVFWPSGTSRPYHAHDKKSQLLVAELQIPDNLVMIVISHDLSPAAAAQLSGHMPGCVIKTARWLPSLHTPEENLQSLVQISTDQLDPQGSVLTFTGTAAVSVRLHTGLQHSQQSHLVPDVVSEPLCTGGKAPTIHQVSELDGSP